MDVTGQALGPLGRGGEASGTISFTELSLFSFFDLCCHDVSNFSYEYSAQNSISVEVQSQTLLETSQRSQKSHSWNEKTGEGKNRDGKGNGRAKGTKGGFKRENIALQDVLSPALV